MFDLESPLWINWELNNICNLMCPQCDRNEIVNGALEKIEGLDTHDNDLETFKRAYNNIRHNVQLIRFQGHYSENVASRDFGEICEFIFSRGTGLSVSTNGSLRSKDFWFDLGQTFSKRDKSRVIFCIDGIDTETLDKYRINANYDKIIENAVSFMSGGGRAEWRMIVFKHNQHQIEEATEISKRLGFREFSVLHTDRRFNMNTPFLYKNKKYILENQDKFTKWNSEVKVSQKYSESNNLENISCKAISENQFYVDYNNKVWACYYIPNMSRLCEQPWYKNYYDDPSNNLLDKTFDEILEDNFFNILQMSWDLKSHCLFDCKSHCSIKRGITRKWQLESGKVFKDRSGREIQSHVEKF